MAPPTATRAHLVRRPRSVPVTVPTAPRWPIPMRRAWALARLRSLDHGHRPGTPAGPSSIPSQSRRRARVGLTSHQAAAACSRPSVAGSSSGRARSATVDPSSRIAGRSDGGSHAGDRHECRRQVATHPTRSPSDARFSVGSRRPTAEGTAEGEVTQVRSATHARVAVCEPKAVDVVGIAGVDRVVEDCGGLAVLHDVPWRFFLGEGGAGKRLANSRWRLRGCPAPASLDHGASHTR